MGSDFVFIDGTALTLHFPVFDALLQFFLLADDIFSEIGVEGFDLNLSFLQNLLNFAVIGFIEVHLRLMLIFSFLQLYPLALLDGRLGHLFAGGEVHLLDNMFFEHEGVDFSFEVVVAGVLL